MRKGSELGEEAAYVQGTAGTGVREGVCHTFCGTGELGLCGVMACCDSRFKMIRLHAVW